MQNIQLEHPFLVAQDLSAIGSLSLSVANPILAAFGSPLAVLPTSLLSTQTEGFDTPAKLPADGWLESTFKHWQQQNIQLSGALIGYLGTDELVTQLSNYLAGQHLPLVVVDPVMADQSELYPGLPKRYSVSMKTLLQYADVIVPNTTEAQLLSGITIGDNPTENEQTILLKSLEKLMPKDSHAIITDVRVGAQTGCVWLEDGKIRYYSCPIINGHFFGSGDVFAALLAGFLLHEESLGDAIRMATDGTYETLKHTAAEETELRFGLNISTLLGEISNYAQTGEFKS